VRAQLAYVELLWSNTALRELGKLAKAAYRKSPTCSKYFVLLALSRLTKELAGHLQVKKAASHGKQSCFLLMFSVYMVYLLPHYV
jgi:hypothetical protein